MTLEPVSLWHERPQLVSASSGSLTRSGGPWCQAGQPVRDNSARSVAAGLAPPFAGPNCFHHVREFCDGVVTVTEHQILHTTRLAFSNGLVLEPSGAAALAAFLHQKIERKETEKTVVIVLTGGNVSPEELSSFPE